MCTHAYILHTHTCAHTFVYILFLWQFVHNRSNSAAICGQFQVLLFCSYLACLFICVHVCMCLCVCNAIVVFIVVKWNCGELRLPFLGTDLRIACSMCDSMTALLVRFDCAICREQITLTTATTTTITKKQQQYASATRSECSCTSSN